MVAAPRLLKLFANYEIATTWYIPGITIDTYGDICRDVHAAGHEIGHHGYDHLSPATMTREEELNQLVRGTQAIERISGMRPRGYRSPGWDLSPSSVELLLSQGFVYDSSMMGHDYIPYRARSGDLVSTGAVPVFGAQTELWELPISWSADDFPHFEYFRGNGLMRADDVLSNWLGDYDYMVEHLEKGVMTYTLHPFVIGRGHRLRMLERLLQELQARGAQFLTAEAAVLEWAGKR